LLHAGKNCRFDTRSHHGLSGSVHHPCDFANHRHIGPSLVEIEAEARLLSGGNPQIAKGDGAVPVKARIATVPGWKGAVGERLDALIGQCAPRLRNALRWISPFSWVGDADAGWFPSFHCFKRNVKVTFCRETALNPVPPVASKVSEGR
jgi:hypothetical protein